MQARDFVFWLQGLLEVGKIETLDADQVALIKAHLDLVFKHDVTIKTKEMEHPIPFPATHMRPVRVPKYEPAIGTPYNPNDSMTAAC